MNWTELAPSHQLPYGDSSPVNRASNTSTAWRIGCGEIWISPPKPRSNSRIIPTAPATASAHSVRVTAEVKLGGANKPKLANSKVSQKTRRATNAFGVPCPTCWANSHPDTRRSRTGFRGESVGWRQRAEEH